MKDKRLIAGVVASVIWLVFMVYMLICGPKPTELNEWGDFFAGFFAPLAFLWLILGYMQQGEELKNSTRALNLQAVELKNSVEQQSKLAQVAQEQMEHIKKADVEHREQQRKLARPRFVFDCRIHAATQTVATKYSVTIKNVGNTATMIGALFDPPLLDDARLRISSLNRDGEAEFRFAFPGGGAVYTKFYLTYTDALGEPGEIHGFIEPDRVGKGVTWNVVAEL